ncbi:MAG: hypothetical protein Q7U14_12710 [Lacisediminimonas sp.]|nr:hypothetical protein [Lacisediminimonas sp.]
MNKRQNTVLYAALLWLALALVGCGGGGGGGGGTDTAVVSPYVASCADGSTRTSAVSVADAQAQCLTAAPPATYTAVVSSPQPSTYPAGSEQKAAFDLLNQERLACGFGTLAQNAALDTAALNHTMYQFINNVSSHEEDKVLYPAGFTGRTVLDRVWYAGYGKPPAVWQASEDFAEGYRSLATASTAGDGTFFTRALLSAPVHLASMMSDADAAGTAFVDSGTIPGYSFGGRRSMALFNFGFQARQSLASNAVVTYPCQGSTGVMWKISNETPGPIPGRDLSVDPIGPGIVVKVAANRVLAISAASVVDVATGIATPTYILNTANDTSNGVVGINLAVVIPLAPLAANTTYQVDVSGSHDAVPFRRSFTFTTGSAAS